MYKDADGIMMVFAKNNKETFVGVRDWIHSIYQNCPRANTPIILVGNKCDIPDPAVTKEMAKQMAERYKIEYIETSAKDNFNITEAFEIICDKTYKNKFKPAQATAETAV